MRIVSTEETQHVTLHPKRVHDIEVFAGSPMYFRIPVKECLVPMTLSLIYKEIPDLPKTANKNLALYFSFTNKNPSQADHFKSAVNVRLKLRDKACSRPSVYEFMRRRQQPRSSASMSGSI